MTDLVREDDEAPGVGAGEAKDLLVDVEAAGEASVLGTAALEPLLLGAGGLTALLSADAALGTKTPLSWFDDVVC